MKEYLSIIKELTLFDGITSDDITPLLSCLNAQIKSYNKNEIILLAGQPVTNVGIVLSGSVQVIQEGIMGERTILARIESGNLFGETYASSNTKVLPVTVASVLDSTILFIDYRRIISSCSSACEFHNRLIRNMFEIISDKNIILSQKMEYLSKRTTREKLLAFLGAQAIKSNGNEFSIGFNRQELADYLCVDRSAMSSELCKLRDEGVLSFNRNEFILHKK